MADLTVPSRGELPRQAEPPRLRLVRSRRPTATERSTARPAPEPAPITRPDDARWVLAVMTSEALEGTLLTPEKRRRLIDLARGWGLSVFDANLIIAVVQDQARRGVEGVARAAAAEPTLRAIAGAGPRTKPRWKRAATLGWLVAGVLGFEIAILLIVFG